MNFIKTCAKTFLWLLRCLDWNVGVDLIIDSMQKIGIAGVALGLFQENEAGTKVGVCILVSGILLAMIIKRQKK